VNHAAVIGAGSWGTGIACVLGSKGVRTSLWARSAEVVAGIRESGRNPRYLTDVTLPELVSATGDLEEAVGQAEFIVIATPSQAVREAAEAIRPLWDGITPVVSLAKGLERITLLRMTEVLAEVLGGRERLAVLSGPNHAEEVSKNIPSATVIAAYDEALGVRLREAFTTPSFRVYTNSDVVGVELASASKNVVAIAAGISDGLGFGDNSKASLMTRGLAEMSRLGRHAGANPLTYMGLAGMGDLIATCTSRHSRNRGLGEAIAHGSSVAQYEAKTGMVAEGAVSCATVDELGAAREVDLPITHLVHEIVRGDKPATEAVVALMGREATDELHGMDLYDE
jgi:glycerol-3-phosphate dehydrogenase (NAD(P)+)